jgi:ABC-type dipeptide/oligopeptide/nickel transport systems, permease components
MSEANPSLQTTAGANSAEAALQGPSMRKQRSLWGDALRRFRKHHMAMAGACLLTIIILSVLVGPYIYRTDPKAINLMIPSMQGPSAEAPLGVDDLGRDLLARILQGGRISLAVGLVAMLLSVCLGTLIGSIAGFFGGMVDQFLMGITDMFLALPQLPMLMLTIYLFRDRLSRAFGPETGIFLLIVFIIGVFNWMTVARLVRASFMSIKQKEFVEAATSLGVSQIAIMARHILPNAFGPIIVAATLDVGSAIIQESVLSFLGLGFPPDTPTWGRLLYDGKDFLEIAPHMVLWPGLMIFLTVLCINYIGDGLRDALDPRSRL